VVVGGGLVLVVSCVVCCVVLFLFLLCVCVCDLFVFLQKSIYGPDTLFTDGLPTK